MERRPIDFGVRHHRLPPGALVSILHRISGLVLVAVLPFLLYALQLSLENASGYARVTGIFARDAGRIALFLVGSAFAHHFFAGVRHLLLDVHIGIERGGGRAGAAAVLIADALAAGLLAWWLWR